MSKSKAADAKASATKEVVKSGPILIKTKGDDKDRTFASAVRTDELKKRITVGTFLAAADKFQPAEEKEDDKATKSKWTVAGAIKQLKTGKITLKFIVDISAIIKTKENSEKFVAGNGYEMLVDIADKGDFKQKDQIKIAIITSLRSNLSTQKVIDNLIERPVILNSIVSWANTSVLDLRTYVYSVVAALPFHTDEPQIAYGLYNRIANAFEHYRTKASEDFRFQHLIMTLRHEQSEKLIHATLSLVYMLANLPSTLEDRLALRVEFRTHAIERAFKRIQETPELDTKAIWDTIKAWKAEGADDEVEYKDMIDEKVSNSISSMEVSYTILEKKIDQNYHVRRVFLEIFKSLLHLPIDKNIGQKKWLIVESVLRQLSGGKDEITFDNDNFYDVIGLLQGLSEDASKELDSLRSVEENQKQLEELSKMRIQLKKIQGDIEELKVKEKKRMEESEKIINFLERDKKMAEEEKQELEIQFKKATGEQKKIAEQLVQSTHKERANASNKKKEVEIKRRDMEKIIQEQEEEKRKMIEELRAAVEEEKQEEIKDAQNDFQQEADQIQEALSKTHQKEIKELSTKQQKEINEIKSSHNFNLESIIGEIKDKYEEMLRKVRDEADDKIEAAETKVRESSVKLAEQEVEIEEADSEFGVLKEKLAQEEAKFAKKMESKTGFLQMLKEQTDELNKLLEAQTEIATKAKLEVLETERKLQVTKQKIEVSESAYSSQLESLQGIKDDRNAVLKEINENEGKIVELNKKVEELQKVIKLKDKELEVAQKDLKEFEENKEFLAEGPVIKGAPPPDPNADNPAPRGPGPTPPPLPDWCEPDPPAAEAPPPPAPPPPGGVAPPPPPPPPPPPGGGAPPPPPPPPPPGGGAPPPPPPPPGGGAPPPPPPPGPRAPGAPGAPPPPPGPRAAGARAELKPRVKMKNLHWTKLRGNQVDKTLFASLDPNSVKIDAGALENLFCQKAAKEEGGGEEGGEGGEGGSGGAPKKPKKEEKQKVQKVTHVNAKSLQAVGIFLRQFSSAKDIKAACEGKDFNQWICNALLSLHHIIDIDRINGLLGAIPDPEEVKTIKEWLAQGGDNKFEILNEVDQFYLSITDKVPHFGNRLKCWKFVLKFDEDNNNVAAELLKIQRGLKAIKYSKGFSKVLEITLAIGNFMNFGTRTGNTVAFEISDLMKLAESSANERSNGTLVDFLMKTLEEKYPDHANWYKEIADVKQTKEASWEKIDLGMGEIRSQLSLVKTLIKEIQSTGPNDKFQSIVQKIQKAEQEFEPTKSLFEGVEREWQNVAKLFGKEASKLKPEAFCGQIWEFVTKYTNCIAERAQREEALQKQKTREDIEKKKEALAKRKTELEIKKNTRETEGNAKESRETSRSEKEKDGKTATSNSTPSTTSSLSASHSGASSSKSSASQQSSAPSSVSLSLPLSASTPAAQPPSSSSSSDVTPRSARGDDDDVQVDEVFSEYEKNPNISSTAETPRRNSSKQSAMSAAEKRKLLEEKRKKLAAARAAKNKS